jgi:ATP-dependent RNA helicase RhlE
LQGNLSQNRRQAALDGFRSGRYQILVATDIAARGIDVAHISHVINYDMPQTAEAYTHRIGRTGRAARTGDAFTLVTRSDTAMVRAIERLIGEPLKRETVPGFDYHAAAPAHDVRSDHAPRHHATPRHYEPHSQDERDIREPRRHDAQERRSDAAPRRRDVQEWRSDAAPNRHKPRSRDTSARSTRADRYDRTVSGRRRP